MATLSRKEQADVKDKLSRLEVEDIIANGNHAGFPSFNQYAKNPDKYRGRDDDLLASIDKGGETFKKYLNKDAMIYEFMGHRTRKPEVIERIIKEHGYSTKDLELKPEIIPSSGYKGDCLCRLLPKDEARKRAKW